MVTPAPSLKTERLILRPHRNEDFEAYSALWADPEVVRFISGKPLSAEESWARLLRASGHWNHLGFGFWAIEEKQSGQLIGEAGFLDLRREIEPSLSGTVEAGWILSQAAQGKGYAGEAMTAVFAWAAENLTIQNFSAIIDPANQGSIRLAEKLGFRLLCETRYHNSAVAIYRKPGACR